MRKQDRSRALFSTSAAGPLNLSEPAQQFDNIVDTGVFHVFSDDERPAYKRSLEWVLRSGGTYFMMCFSDLQPGDWGPRRVTIEPSTFETNIGDARAWLASISRL